MNRKPIEGIDYTLGEDGREIFTARYLLSLGFCCRMECPNCPYQAKSLVYDEPTDEITDAAYI